MALFSGKSKSQTEVSPMRRDQVLDWQNRYYSLLDQPFEMYPDQMYAEMDPLQEEALGMREEYAGGLGRDILDPSMGAWQSMLDAPDVANNPYVQNMLDQQSSLLQRNFQESLPSMRAGMLGVNERLGGSGQGVAEGIAMRGMQDALARTAADTQLRAYQAGLGQQRYGLGAAPALASLGTMPSDILAGVGDVRRGEAQREIDEDMARFNFAQEEPWRRLERFVGPYAAMSQPYTTTTAKASSTPSAFNRLMQVGGLVSSFFGGGGGGGGGFTQGSENPTFTPAASMSSGVGMGPVGMYGMGSMTPMMGAYNPMNRGMFMSASPYAMPSPYGG